jgi:hypothetical protein
MVAVDHPSGNYEVSCDAPSLRGLQFRRTNERTNERSDATDGIASNCCWKARLEFVVNSARAFDDKLTARGR